jgi:primase-polymerase (primpol)-like protein
VKRVAGKVGGIGNTGNERGDPSCFDAIPLELRQLDRWAVHINKEPYNARTGNRASSTDSATWSSFDQCLKALASGKYEGLGFMFGHPYCATDLDHCGDAQTGELRPHARRIAAQENTYTEWSMSGTGLHLISKAALQGPGFNRVVEGNKIEFYDTARFLVFTGNRHLDYPAEICERQSEIESLYKWAIDSHEAEQRNKQKSKQTGSARPSCDPNSVGEALSDSEVMGLAMNATNGAKFGRLYGGDMSDYADDQHPAGNPSCADAGFVMMLCFYSQDDSQVERLWKSSGLYRAKLERADYVSRTIGNVRSHQSVRYSANWNGFKSKGKSNGTGAQPSNDIGRALTGREQIICRAFAYWGISDESFRTYIAMRGIFDGRKIARIAGAKIGRHIKARNESESESSRQAYGRFQRFGNRRKDALLDDLKNKVDYPLLKKIENGKMIVQVVRGVEEIERIPARFKLDETPFDEAEKIASLHPAMHYFQSGPDYNPGKAREEAALIIARKYSKFPEPDSEPERPERDEFAIWVDTEKRALKLIQKLSDILEDLNKSQVERNTYAKQFLGRADEILTLKITRNKRRKRKKMQLVTKPDFAGVGSPVTLRNKQIESIRNNDEACISHADKRKGANGLIIPGPAIWKNADYDGPVIVTGDAGSGSDGRHYAAIEGSSTAIPADELVYPDDMEVF